MALWNQHPHILGIRTKLGSRVSQRVKVPNIWGFWFWKNHSLRSFLGEETLNIGYLDPLGLYVYLGRLRFTLEGRGGPGWASGSESPFKKVSWAIAGDIKAPFKEFSLRGYGSFQQ